MVISRRTAQDQPPHQAPLPCAGSRRGWLLAIGAVMVAAMLGFLGKMVYNVMKEEKSPAPAVPTGSVTSVGLLRADKSLVEERRTASGSEPRGWRKMPPALMTPADLLQEYQDVGREVSDRYPNNPYVSTVPTQSPEQGKRAEALAAMHVSAGRLYYSLRDARTAEEHWRRAAVLSLADLESRRALVMLQASDGRLDAAQHAKGDDRNRAGQPRALLDARQSPRGQAAVRARRTGVPEGPRSVPKDARGHAFLAKLYVDADRKTVRGGRLAAPSGRTGADGPQLHPLGGGLLEKQGRRVRPALRPKKPSAATRGTPLTRDSMRPFPTRRRKRREAAHRRDRDGQLPGAAVPDLAGGSPRSVARLKTTVARRRGSNPVQRRIHRPCHPLRVRFAVEEGAHALRFPLGLPDEIVVTDSEDLHLALPLEPRIEPFEVQTQERFNSSAAPQSGPIA